MIELERKDFMSNPLYKRLHDYLAMQHVASAEERQLVLKNAHKTNCTIMCRRFTSSPNDNLFCMHYDVMLSLNKAREVTFEIMRMVIYENIAEFETDYKVTKEYYTMDLSYDHIKK